MAFDITHTIKPIVQTRGTSDDAGREAYTSSQRIPCKYLAANSTTSREVNVTNPVATVGRREREIQNGGTFIREISIILLPNLL